MKILMVTSETVPFAKTGGLADAVSALAINLRKQGHDVRIVMPRYYKIDRSKLKAIDAPLAVAAGTIETWVKVYEAPLPGSDVPVYPVSAATHQGFDQLLRAVAGMLSGLPEAAPFEEEEIELIAAESGQYTITRENQVFVLSGPAVSMLLLSVNFDDEESMNWFHRTMRRAGIIDALREKGAKEGSVIRIEDTEFDFIE